MMSKQYEITGVGNPNTVTGEVKLYTTAKEPFVVNDTWLGLQSKRPAVGDVIEVSDTGELTLGAGVASGASYIEEQAAGEQKKNHTPAESGSGSELSPFKEYQGKPVIVYAAEITAVSDPAADGTITVTFADGTEKQAYPAMTSRMIPVLGDYWVVAGVYEYLNPKAVFEAKYQPYVKE